MTMNNKMSKFSFNQINAASGRRGGVKDGRLISCYVAPDDKKKTNFRWRVSLSGKVVSLAALTLNDYMTFEFDEGVVLLKKGDASSGRKLSNTAKSDRLHLRFTMPKQYIGFFMDRDAVEVETSPDGRICFKLV
jgi:hypothetical protein